MIKIELKFAELHNPLFLAGKNFQTKLDCEKTAGLKLVYDRGEKELLVYWENEEGILPSSNVACMVKASAEDKKPTAFVHPIVAGKQTAQVSSPMSHVFEGPGAGKTGKDK